eukprot:TRINITY_DN11762_c0_g1_i3.p2 TRINITY_DN11762_c0_g1~~TRINITY_DN11762_c0_g1_i3.p2  ORF type:complete len:168 (+),score=26.96 TRINITY_DN11762_c0_g1_i3:2213-2716(+)
MGSFLSQLFSLWSQDVEHKIIIVGLDNAGKTTILYQFLLNEVVVTSPTIGSNVEEVQFKNMKFLMWDVGGQESLRSSWTTYYTAVEAVLLVVDSTDRERLLTIKEELYSMLAHEVDCKMTYHVAGRVHVRSVGSGQSKAVGVGEQTGSKGKISMAHPLLHRHLSFCS